MRRHTTALCLVALLSSGTAAIAQQRPVTRTLTCSAIQTLVAREGHVELSSSDTAFEEVHRDSGVCINGETAAPAYEPASDDPSCLAGWRCKQRNNDGSR